MKVLITGAAGFTGLHMMKFLAREEVHQVTGMIRQQVSCPGHLLGPIISADLLDRQTLSTALADICPDAVIHLAGVTQGTRETLFANNVTGTKNLLDATLAINPACRILIISSSSVYGNAGNFPISENTFLKPVSDYGESKVAQEQISQDFCRSGAAIAIARPFNLVGPGQTSHFICGNIINQILEIKFRKRDAITLREILSARDFIDVRDVVRGYWALISHSQFATICSGNAYNLGSGTAYRISDVISVISEITGDCYEIRTPDIIPSIPVPTQRSNNNRIRSLTGWLPEITLEETLRDMIEYTLK